MKKYIGTKILKAEPLGRIDFLKSQGQVHELEKIKDIPGYKVEYPDGYVSWSPVAVFEESYRLADGMNFGLALEAMRKGFHVRRLKWPANNFIAYRIERELLGGSGYFGKYTFQNKSWFPEWVPSREEMLADNWMIV